MNKAWTLGILAFGLAIFLAMPDAQAGRSGGSFGGRSGFSASRSSSSFGGSARSSSGGSFGGGSGGGFRGGSHFGGGMPGVFFLGGGGSAGTCGDGGTFIGILVVGMLIFIGVKTYRAYKRLKGGGAAALPDGVGATVARLSVGFYATEQALQRGLNALARTGKGGTPAGDAYLLREATVLMIRAQEAAARVYFEQHPGLADAAASSKLEALGMDLRGRFEHESVRADEGGLRELPNTLGTSEPVAEFVVVSLAAAFTGGSFQTARVTGADSLIAVLREFGALGADRLLGMEVAWDPVSPEESLTSEEMDLHYAELSSL